MATPKTVTDGSSDLDEDVLNLFLRAGKLQVKVNYCTILFTAATNTPTVSASYDSDGEIVTGDLSYDGTPEINIVLTGYTVAPTAFAQIVRNGNSSSNIGDVQIAATSTVLGLLRFVSGAAGGNTALDPDGDVTVAVMFIGV